ncbi:MAG: peptidoglycan DD-metalloendopeptidase family protein, partial [Planctomycetota bacterium]
LTVEGGRERAFPAWAADIEARRVAANAPAAVGYHDETRLLYRSDAFAEAREDGPEPRTIHLGVDLFAPEGAEVFAPLDGSVLSVQRNPAPLDYGPTVILEHAGEDGRPFFTLYGHLDEEVLVSVARRVHAWSPPWRHHGPPGGQPPGDLDLGDGDLPGGLGGNL